MVRNWRIQQILQNCNNFLINPNELSPINQSSDTYNGGSTPFNLEK